MLKYPMSPGLSSQVMPILEASLGGVCPLKAA